jgi:hypothetical protein
MGKVDTFWLNVIIGHRGPHTPLSVSHLKNGRRLQTRWMPARSGSFSTWQDNCPLNFPQATRSVAFSFQHQHIAGSAG